MLCAGNNSVSLKLGRERTEKTPKHKTKKQPPPTTKNLNLPKHQ